MDTLPKDTFFSRKNFIRAGWAVLISLLSFSAGLLIDKFKGPQPVIVQNIKDINQPSINPFKQPINIVSKEAIISINKLAAELQRVQKTVTNEDSTTHIAEIKSQLSTLDDELTRIKSTIPPNIEKVENNRQDGSKSIQYKLPATVKGYTRASFGGIYNATCPASDIDAIYTINVSFSLRNVDLLKDITPLFVDISKVNSSTSYELIFFKQYQLTGGYNSFSFPVDLAPGNYELAYGYYRKADLKEEYPHFYSKICTLKVTDKKNESNKMVSESDRKITESKKKLDDIEEQKKAIKPPQTREEAIKRIAELDKIMSELDIKLAESKKKSDESKKKFDDLEEQKKAIKPPQTGRIKE